VAISRNIRLYRIYFFTRYHYNFLMRLNWKIFLFAVTILLAASAPAGHAEKVKEFDLGDVNGELSVSHSFTFSNSEKEVLGIINVRTSCPCLLVISYPETVCPGKEAKIVTSLRPEKTGKLSYKVFVETDSKKLPLIAYSLTANVKKVADAKTAESGMAGVPEGLITRRLKQSDEEMSMPYERFMKFTADNTETAVVDVRPPEQFEKCRIPGSLNIPLYAVKTKSFLKDKPLVLVGEGWSTLLLEQECAELNEKGFGAQMLRGGINAWLEGGGKGVSPADQSSVNRMDPSAFFVEKDYDHWLLIDVSDKEDLLFREIFPDAARISFDKSPEKSARAVKDLVEGRQASGPVMLLFLSADGEGYDAVEKAVAGAGIKNDFYLRGGWKGYTAYLKELSAKPQTKTTATSMGSTRQKVLKKPCGSCP
jgi:rhodanese-related sulfurtransferase